MTAGSDDKMVEAKEAEAMAIAQSFVDLPSDHALLQRAQESLRAQLLEIKQELVERVREKQRGLKDAEQRRQDSGLELYDFQEHLSNINNALQQTQNHTVDVNRSRTEAEECLATTRLRTKHEEDQTTLHRKKANAKQEEVDRLNAALKQIEKYNQDAENEIRVAQRETEATQSALKQIGKEKDDQDFLILDLQRTLKQNGEEHILLQGQLEAQSKEKHTAEDTLVQAHRDMENVHFEKQQLLSVWKSTLIQLQRKDETLGKTKMLLKKQKQTALELDNQTSLCQRDIRKQQERNEQTKLVLKRVDKESKTTSQKLNERETELQTLQTAVHEIQSNVKQVDSELESATATSRYLTDESESCRGLYLKTCKETQELREVILTSTHDQTATERSSGQAQTDLQQLMKATHEKEITTVNLQNEIANLQMLSLNSKSQNLQLKDTLELLESELNDKVQVAHQMELESRQRESEIDKQTRELDALNRKYQQLTSNMEDESTGPLEATINNMRREIHNKETESQEIQRRWMQKQMDLVVLEKKNSELREDLAMIHSKTSVMKQKKRRLEAQLKQNITASKMLKTSMNRLHRDIQSLNSVIAKNSEWSTFLENQTSSIETEIEMELREMESEGQQIEATIQDITLAKRDIVAEIVETEKEIMVWERKVELEKELQAALEEEENNDGVDCLKKEIHRMELRITELTKHQEHLIRDMEVGIQKRQSIRFKKEALANRNTGDTTQSKAEKCCDDLRKSIQATQKETTATEARLKLLKEKRSQIVRELEAVGKLLTDERSRQNNLELKIQETRCEKAIGLAETVMCQKLAKKFEDILNRRFRSPIQKLDTLSQELDKALSKFDVIERILQRQVDEKSSFWILQGIAQYRVFNRLYDKV